MPARPIIPQEATTFGFQVQTVAGPIAAQIGINSLIDSFTVTVPEAAANSIFLGFNAGVTIANGIELLAGTTTQFRINQEGRQLYEIQNLLRSLTEYLQCGEKNYEYIPFVAWDMSQIYVVAAAATDVSFALFKAVYI